MYFYNVIKRNHLFLPKENIFGIIQKGAYLFRRYLRDALSSNFVHSDLNTDPNKMIEQQKNSSPNKC